MTPAPFAARTTSAFDRDFRKLARQHRELIEHYGRAVAILASDRLTGAARTTSKSFKACRPPRASIASGSTASVSATTSRAAS